MLMNDIWGYITQFIEDNKDICRLMMTCKEISNCRFYFNGKIILTDEIVRSGWFDRFTNIELQSVMRKLPLSINHLWINWEFNDSIENKIPLTVTHLHFDSIKVLPTMFPSSITHLIFGHNFNRSIAGCIPSSVVELIFGISFNQPINDCIPSSVGILKFTDDFNQPISGFIPSSVRQLELGCKFNQNLQNIPSSITFLILDKINSQMGDYIPTSIIKLVIFNFTEKIIMIPSSVTHLAFGLYNELIKNIIPTSVTNLAFGRFDICIKDNIPSSVVFLNFGFPSKSYDSIGNCIPSSVRRINFNGKYSDEDRDYICRSLKGVYVVFKP